LRGGRLAMPLALPAAGWLIVVARQRYLSGNKLIGALGLVASWLGFAGVAIGVYRRAGHDAFAGKAAASSGHAERRSVAACLLPLPRSPSCRQRAS